MHLKLRIRTDFQLFSNFILRFTAFLFLPFFAFLRTFKTFAGIRNGSHIVANSRNEALFGAFKCEKNIISEFSQIKTGSHNSWVFCCFHRVISTIKPMKIGSQQRINLSKDLKKSWRIINFCCFKNFVV